MEKRIKARSRALAVTALVAGFVAVVAVAAIALQDDSSIPLRERTGGQVAPQKARSEKKVPATYVVESGDTLTSIAHETGVPIATIERLNPEVDPQILVAGEELKLR